MSDLEQALWGLGSSWDVPATPDVAAAAAGRLRAPLPRRRRRRGLMIAVAVGLAVPASVAAVPPARDAVLRLVGLRGVEVRRVESLPRPSVASTELGERLDLAAAKRRASFVVAEPGGRPGAVYFRPEPAGGMVSLVYGDLVLSEFLARHAPAVALKLVTPRTAVVRTTVDGAPAAWIAGAHQVGFVDRTGRLRRESLRPSRRALIWERAGVTFRMEAGLGLKEARRIAATVRPR